MSCEMPQRSAPRSRRPLLHIANMQDTHTYTHAYICTLLYISMSLPPGERRLIRYIVLGSLWRLIAWTIVELTSVADVVVQLQHRRRRIAVPLWIWVYHHVGRFAGHRTGFKDAPLYGLRPGHALRINGHCTFACCYCCYGGGNTPNLRLAPLSAAAVASACFGAPLQRFATIASSPDTNTSRQWSDDEEEMKRRYFSLLLNSGVTLKQPTSNSNLFVAVQS